MTAILTNSNHQHNCMEGTKLHYNISIEFSFSLTYIFILWLKATTLSLKLLKVMYSTIYIMFRLYGTLLPGIFFIYVHVSSLFRLFLTVSVMNSSKRNVLTIMYRYYSISLLLHLASCRFTKYPTTNKSTNCMSFILNHFFKTLFLLLHVSIAYRLSSSGSTYSS